MLPDDFIVQDKETISTKINEFQQAGNNSRVHLLLDFDRTITMGINKKDDGTTWQVLCRHLPEEAKLKNDELYDKYRPLEAAGTITDKQAETWPTDVLNLFVKYRVNLNLIEEDFFHVATLRHGVDELFRMCMNRDIPIVVLSAGIKNVIDLLLSKSGIKSAVTISTELMVNSEGIIIGWDKTRLVHTANKRELGHKEVTRIREQKPYCILVGDSLHDADMVDGKNDVLRIRLFDPRLDETQNIEEVKDETFAKFDLITKSFAPIVELISQIS